MKAFVSFKFKEDYSDRKLIEEISSALEKIGIESIIMVRDFEKWGEVKFSPEELMRLTFEQIDLCDFHIIEFSEKGVGLGIEAGYAFAKNKPIIVIAKKDSHISDTLKGIAKQIIFYNTPNDIEKIIF